MQCSISFSVNFEKEAHHLGKLFDLGFNRRKDQKNCYVRCANAAFERLRVLIKLGLFTYFFVHIRYVRCAFHPQ